MCLMCRVGFAQKHIFAKQSNAGFYLAFYILFRTLSKNRTSYVIWYAGKYVREHVLEHVFRDIKFVSNQDQFCISDLNILYRVLNLEIVNHIKNNMVR